MSLEDRALEILQEEEEDDSESVHDDIVVDDVDDSKHDDDDDDASLCDEDVLEDDAVHDDEDEEEDVEVDMDDFLDIRVTRYSEPLKGSTYTKKYQDILEMDMTGNIFYSCE